MELRLQGLAVETPEQLQLLCMYSTQHLLLDVKGRQESIKDSLMFRTAAEAYRYIKKSISVAAPPEGFPLEQYKKFMLRFELDVTDAAKGATEGKMLLPIDMPFFKSFIVPFIVEFEWFMDTETRFRNFHSETKRLPFTWSSLKK